MRFTVDDCTPCMFPTDICLNVPAKPSNKDWIKGEKIVPTGDLDHLSKVSTTCMWRGHHFEVGIIVGNSANVVYLGKDFDAVSPLPGMRRPDKYEVRGRAPVSELTDVAEHVEEVPLGDQSNS